MRGENSDAGVEPRENVGESDTDLHRAAARRAFGPTGKAHQSAHALDQKVVAGTARVRATLAEPGDRAVDEARIECLETFVVQPVRLQATDLEVLDQDVGPLRQLSDETLPIRFADIDRQRSLAAIGTEVVSRLAGDLTVRACQPGRTPCAGVVSTARALDLDDVRSQITEKL